VSKYIPPGFDADAVRQGLLNAMGFGEPTRTEDKAWFYFPKMRTPATTSSTDQDGVPFDPTVQVTTADSKARLQVSCAIEYIDADGQVITAGEVIPSKLKITLMDAEYQQVKGFAYVVAGGDKYLYSRTEPPVALGSIDFWFVHCTAEDES
jgi:hypothetical protein